MVVAVVMGQDFVYVVAVVSDETRVSVFSGDQNIANMVMIVCASATLVEARVDATMMVHVPMRNRGHHMASTGTMLNHAHIVVEKVFCMC